MDWYETWNLGYTGKNNEKKDEKQPLVDEKKRGNTNQKIGESITNYFLSCIKNKCPSLIKEYEEVISKELEKYIQSQIKESEGKSYESGTSCISFQRLLIILYGMNIGSFSSALPINEMFKDERDVMVKSGKCATITGMHRQDEILYITDEYKQELLASIDAKIMEEESRIPQEVRDGFEQEYQTLMEALEIERQPLVEREKERQRILDQKKALELKARQLIESYAKRIEDLEALGLSESEKEQKKQEIIREIKQAQYATESDQFREQLDRVEEKYDWQTLKLFDYNHKEELNKELWLREKYNEYARKKYFEMREENTKRSAYSGTIEPYIGDTPVSLNELYSKRSIIEEYDRKQKEKSEKSEDITMEQEKFVEALGRAYVDYMKAHNYINSDALRNDREKLLVDGFSKYFASNYKNLTNPEFLIEFENGAMQEIAEEGGFINKYSTFLRWGDVAHVKASEDLIYFVDEILYTATIEYATPEAIQTQIDKLNSEIKFMKDAGESLWSIRKLESQRDSFISYQRQLQGKPKIEPPLEDLDQQKHILEIVSEKIMNLSQQHDRRSTTQEIENDGIDWF